MSAIHIRPAQDSDIPNLIKLIDIAAYGFVEHLHTELFELESREEFHDILESRIEDPDSQFALHKAKIAELDGATAGFIMCEDLPDPINLAPEETHPLLRPLFELENMVPGTTLVNFIAAFPETRGKGIATHLLDHAEESRGSNGMSLTVHNQNPTAIRLYEHRGYQQIARRPIIKEGWNIAATDWILMTKP